MPTPNHNLNVDLARKMRKRLQEVHLEPHEIDVILGMLDGPGLANFLLIIIEEMRQLDQDTFIKLGGIRGIIKTALQGLP